MVLQKTLESPLDSKEIKPVNPKGNQPWIFIGRTDAEALILWPPDGKSQLIGKDPSAGKDWGQEEKGVTEDEMVDSISDSLDMNLSKLQEIVMDRELWHAAVRWVTESDITEWLNNNKNYWVIVSVQRRTAYSWVVREDLLGLVYALACFTYFVEKDAKEGIENTMF